MNCINNTLHFGRNKKMKHHMGIIDLTDEQEALIDDYYKRSGDKLHTADTMFYMLGTEMAIDTFKEADGRLIRFAWGKDPDQIDEITFGKPKDTFRRSSIHT